MTRIDDVVVVLKQREDTMEAKERTYLVTGASRGIGRGIAEAFAKEGAAVAINYRRSAQEAEDVASHIRDRGARAMAVKADVTDEDEVDRMYDEIHAEFGSIDVLVNNAGVTDDTLFVEMTREEWDRVIGINLDGVFVCTKRFFDDIRGAPDGRLINISSVVGKQGNLGQANYAAAKSGMFGFTRTLALELADAGSTANCIAPGFTRTNMVEAIPERVQQKIEEQIPLGRFATIEEIAGVVRFIASPEASYITGEVIDVNGGMDL